MVNGIQFTVLGEPFSKQSMKFTKKGYAYTPKETKKKQTSFQESIRNQLPEGWVLWDGIPLRLVSKFVFYPPKSMKKSTINFINAGGIVYKHTRPDLQDNLHKGVIDAMQGIVFTNDSQIALMGDCQKIYGFQPRTEISLTVLQNYLPV